MQLEAKQKGQASQKLVSAWKFKNQFSRRCLEPEQQKRHYSTSTWRKRPMTNPVHRHTQILRMKRLCARLDVHKNTVYNWLSPASASYDPLFPRPIRLTTTVDRNGGCVGWIEADIEKWLELRIAACKQGDWWTNYVNQAFTYSLKIAASIPFRH